MTRNNPRCGLIISDDEIERVHGNANFGPTITKRQVVTEGVIKYSLGFTSGHTQLCILVEHGLVKPPKPGSYQTTLTAKGRDYLRAALTRHIWEIVKLTEPAAMLAEADAAAKFVVVGGR
jgi:hypothetical protein